MRSTLIVTVFLGLLACSSNKPDGAPATVAPQATSKPVPGPGAKAAAAAPATSSAEAAALPTEEDFEDQAEKDVTDKTLEAEVKKLEQEIGE